MNIVVTGSASSGKTSVLDRLSADLSRMGYRVFVLSETATELLKAGFDCTTQTFLFQKTLFSLQHAREQIYRSYITAYPAERAVLLLDRALPDGAVYIDRTRFQEILSLFGFTCETLLRRYDAVIQLQPSAVVTEYEKESNNAYRVETDARECFRQDEALRALYAAHPRYRYVEARQDMEEKYRDVLRIVQGLLDEGEKAE